MNPNLIKVEPNDQYSTNLLGINPRAGILIHHHPQPGQLQQQHQVHVQQQHHLQQQHMGSVGLNSVNMLLSPGQPSTTPSPYPSSIGSHKQRWNESPEARARRLARNAERMRERRSRESEDEYRKRLARNAEANRMRRQNESEMERAMRLVRNAARQRLRRAMESPEQRAKRLAKLAERMRHYRANETPEQRKERLAEMAARARSRISRETSEERKDRLRKLNDYAKKVRLNKKRLKELGINNLNQDLSQESNQSIQHLDHHQQGQGGQQLNEGTNIQNSHQAYPHSSLANSIEYYQNMFINQSFKTNSDKATAGKLQQNFKFGQNSNNTVGIALDNTEQANAIFQQAMYEKDVKPVLYGTVASTIEYYQNKFIKEKTQPGNVKSVTIMQVQLDPKVVKNLQGNFVNEQQASQQNQHQQQQTQQQQHQSQHQTQNTQEPQQIQNTGAPVYNQFAYVNNFSTSTPVAAPPTTSTNNAQQYYPVYHNGFQLGLATGTVPPPFTPVHFQTTQTPGTLPYTLINSTTNNSPAATITVSTQPEAHQQQQHQQQQQILQQQTQVIEFPKPVRGRPRKIFNDNDFSRLPMELQEEALRQHKVNTLLENEINQMLSSPGRQRRRSGRIQETDEERRIRLDKMAAHQRKLRANESPEERAVRLKSLSERARLKRAQVRATESDSQKRLRLARQAEYARLRRLKSQNPETKKKIELRAKELYAQLHSVSTNSSQRSTPDPNISNSYQQQLQHQNQTTEHHNSQQQQQQLSNNINEEFVKNPGKDFAQSENNDVLKILEPIIVMKTK